LAAHGFKQRVWAFEPRLSQTPERARHGLPHERFARWRLESECVEALRNSAQRRYSSLSDFLNDGRQLVRKLRRLPFGGFDGELACFGQSRIPKFDSLSPRCGKGVFRSLVD